LSGGKVDQGKGSDNDGGDGGLTFDQQLKDGTLYNSQ